MKIEDLVQRIKSNPTKENVGMALRSLSLFLVRKQRKPLGELVGGLACFQCEDPYVNGLLEAIQTMGSIFCVSLDKEERIKFEQEEDNE